MAELKWKTPVPRITPDETERSFILRLTRWIGEQEREPDFDLDEYLAFGGIGVANRILGFEGLITGYSAPSTHTIMTAPSGSSKKVIIALNTIVNATAVFHVVKAKGAVDSLIAEVDNTAHAHANIVDVSSGFITLDAEDETIEIQTVSGTTDISYSGSYLDID